MSKTLQTSLDQATKEIATLEAQLAKARHELLNKQKVALLEGLNSAANLYQNLPEEQQRALLSDTEVASVLGVFGVKNGAKGRTHKTRKSDDEVLAFLSTERTTGEVEKFAGWSGNTTGKKLGAWLEAKAVTMRRDEEDKKRKLWKKV